MQIEGRNAVIELFKSDKDIRKLYLQKNINRDSKITQIIHGAQRRHLKVLWQTSKELDKMSETGSHQGVIAVTMGKSNTVSLKELIQDPRKTYRLIYIRESFHTHNIGAIIRTAECAGFDGIILSPKTTMNPDIVRASVGASEHLNIYNESLFPIINELRDAAFKIIGIERSDNSTNLYETDLTGNVLLIIGGEDRSLSEEIINKCDTCVEIPMKGKVNSLNMSVACAVVIYETVRQSL